MKQEMETDFIKQEIKCERIIEFEEVSERILYRWLSQEEMMDIDQDFRDVSEVNYIVDRFQSTAGVKCLDYESL